MDRASGAGGAMPDWRRGQVGYEGPAPYMPCPVHANRPLIGPPSTPGHTRKPKDTADAAVSEAILVHMWLKARRQWQARNTAIDPTALAKPAAASPGAISVATAAPGGASSDKPPNNFPQWADQIELCNNRLLGGQRREFPVKELLGAEEVLARLWHEHTKSKMYKALTLGEILCRRTWAAGGKLNGLALKRQTAHSSSALKVVGDELHAVEEKEWEPKSMLTVLDGAEAAT